MDEISLIRGTFDVGTASDVLFSALNSKIIFHKIQIGENEGAGQKNTNSQERLRELEESKLQVAEILKIAHELGHDLEINASISIQLKEGKKGL